MTPDVLDTPAAGGLAIRGGALRAVGYVAGALLALGTAPLVVRHLGAVDFGRYMSVVSLIAVVAGVTDLGLGALVTREYSVRHGDERDAFMRSVLGARLGLTALGVVGATAFAALAGYGEELVLGTVLAGLGALIGVAGATVGVALGVQMRLGWLTGIDLAGKFLGALLLVGLVLASASVLPFLAASVPVAVVAVLMTLPLVRGSVPLRPSLAFGEIVGLLRETLPIAASVVLGTLYARFVIVVMSVIAAGLETGYFGTAYRVLEVAIGVPFALIGTTFPIFARAADQDRARLAFVLQRVFEVALIGGVWMTLVTASTAGAIADILARPEEAEPVAKVLFVLAFALVPVFLNLTFQTALLSLRRHREQVISNGAALVFVIALAFALIPPFGARGGAFAVVIGECFLALSAAVLLLRAHREIHLRLGLLPRLAVATMLAVAVQALVGGPGVLGASVGSVVYFLSLGGLGAIPREARDALIRRH